MWNIKKNDLNKAQKLTEMKKEIVLTTFLLLFAMFTRAQIDHLEPPFWWAGMKNPSLQLLVHGEDIGGSKVSFSYEGVSLEAVHTPENQNYLFVDLILAHDVEPGSFEISFT